MIRITTSQKVSLSPKIPHVMSREPAKPDPLRRSAHAKAKPALVQAETPSPFAHRPSPSNWADDVPVTNPHQPLTLQNPHDQLAIFLQRLQESVYKTAQKHPETEELRHASALIETFVAGRSWEQSTHSPAHTNIPQPVTRCNRRRSRRERTRMLQVGVHTSLYTLQLPRVNVTSRSCDMSDPQSFVQTLPSSDMWGFLST